MRWLFSLSIFLTILLFSPGCEKSSVYRYAEGEIWHTFYHIAYCSSSNLDDSIKCVMDSVDLSLSYFNPESELSKVNRSGKSMKVSEMINEVYLLSRRIWLLTDSVFDPTISPAINAWGFGQGHKISPDTLSLDSLRCFIGFEKTSLKDGLLTKSDPRIEFNFSAVAKGYGVDRVAAMFERNKVDNYLIEIGGEIRNSGVNSSGQLWNIGIDTPTENSSAQTPIGETVTLSGKGLATSGNYRNYHRSRSGQSFGHTISPRSLRPVSTDLLSVTIIAPTCAEADALATASMVLGYSGASTLLDSLRYPALFILRSSTDSLEVRRNSYFP